MPEDLRGKRRHDVGPTKPSASDTRSPFRHDRDRILYSPEFRRLSGITQVISPLGHYVTHNRLTHTLEVAQIARAVAETLLRRRGSAELIEKAGGLDLDVAEAAALAHDIGHPPFGHVTEETLKQKLRGKGLAGFEGNAQSFRILTELSVHDTIYSGLNLTRATLSAVSKYPWLEEREGKAADKWGVYSEQRDDFRFSREHLPSKWRTPPQQPSTEYRTLEAEVMDWADDVAYAIHDLEDFYKAGLIPLDKLRASAREREQFIRYRVKNDDFALANQDEYSEIAETLLHRNSPFLDAFNGSKYSRAYLQRFSSGKVGEYIVEPELVDASNDRGWNLQIAMRARVEVNVLKGLLWYYVIDSPSMISTRMGYQNMISGLFDILVNSDIGKSHSIYPKYFHERVVEDASDSNVYRTAADFITNLTESQVADLYRRLTGTSIGDPLDRIVH
jgi:dGTPase